MKLKIQFLYALMAVPMMLNAQSVDDDMYFVPGKKSSNSRTTVSNTASTTARQTLRVPVNSVDTVADYHTGTLRDVDDYNRRGGTQMSARLVGDTLYLDSVPQRNDRSIRDYDQRGYYDDYDYYDDDYYYSSRLMRYRGYHFYDPFMWDFCYGWYDPWYDPWYGWYGPYYRHGFYSWYDWGWGWHHRPGWDLGWYWGGYYGPYWGGYHPGHRTGYIYSNGGRRLGSGNTGFTSRSGSRGGRVSAPTGSRGNVTRSGTRGNVEYNGSRGGGLNRQGSVSGTTRGMRGEPSVNNSTRSSRSTVRGNNESNVNTRGTTTNSRGTTSSSSRGTTSSVTRGSSSSSSSSSRGGGFSGGGGSRGGGFSGGGGGGFSGGGGSRGGGGRGGR